MKSKKRFKLYWVIFIILAFAALVIAQAVTKSPASIANATAVAESDTIHSETDSTFPLQPTAASPSPSAPYKPPAISKDIKVNFANLKKEFIKAGEEREKNKKVSDKTKTNATTIAEAIDSKYSKLAKDNETKGRTNVAKYYKKTGDHVKLLTKINIKDKISSKDFDKIKKSSNERQKAYNKVLKGTDPSTLTPAQKKYLLSISIANFKNCFTSFQNIMETVQSKMQELKSSGKGKGGFGFVKKLASGGEEMGFLKSIMEYLQHFMKNITANIQSITKIAQS